MAETQHKRMEKALLKSEQTLKSIIENIHDIIFQLSPRGFIQYVSPKVKELYGYKPEDLIGKHFKKTTPMNEVPKVLKAMKSILSGKTIKNLQINQLDSKGKIVTMEINATPVKKQGRIITIQGIMRNINERKCSEEALRQSKKTLSQIVQGNPVPTFVIDDKHIITHWNKACENLTGIPANEMIGTRKQWLALYPIKRPVMADLIVDGLPEEEIARHYRGKHRKSALIEGAYEAEDFFPHLGKKGKWLFFTAAPLRSVEGKVIGAIETLQDITERKQAEEKIKYLSFHDSLTDLYNRAYFEEETKKLNTARKYPIAIIMADINNLKFINDAFGHEKGDELLKRLAHILASMFRKEDVVARIGGDEFAIILPNVGEKTVESFCERIINACKDSNRESSPELSLSLGYAIQYGQYKDIQEALRAADDHMYKDKLVGRTIMEKSIIDFLRITLVKRDPHTEKHSEELQELAASLGRDIGLPEYRLKDLRLLAILHDIGKVGTPDSILYKADGLSPEEWEIMKKHSEMGYRIAKNIPELALIAEDILSHHEWWNGKGYPRGLKGEEIPILARIISIIDAYNAIQSERPYKKARPKGEAIKEIKKGAGTQFDPKLVERFLKIVGDE